MRTRDGCGNALVQRHSDAAGISDDEVLEVARPGVRSTAQHDNAAIRAVEVGLHRVAAEIGVGSHSVGTMAVERFDRVVLRSTADVAALGVEDHGHARMALVDVCDQAFQRAFGALCRKVRELRLEAADEVGGGIDDRAAELERRIR